MSKDMELFGKTLLPNTFYQKTPDFHKEIYKVFEDINIPRVLIVAPRGHGKSSVTGLVLALHHIFFGKDSFEGRKNILLISKTQGHAKGLLNSIKENLEANSNVHYFFGKYDESNSKRWRDDQVILKNDTQITAIGTGQQLRGTKHGNTRPTLIIVDDPEDENNTKTLDAMNANFDWLLGGALPAVDDPETSKAVVIGTVVNKYCIVNRLKDMNLESKNSFKKLWYKAIQDDGKTVLWKERRSLQWLLDERKAYTVVGKASLWYMEYQNEVVAPETQPFKEEYIKYHNYKLNSFPKYHYAEVENRTTGKRIPVNVYMGIDPASSIESTADYSAICVLAMDHAKNVYIIDFFHNRVHPMDLAETIVKYNTKYSPNGVNIETVGYQEMLRDYFRYNKIYISGLERKNQPRTPKSKRILSFQPHFAGGVIWLDNGMDDFVSELIQYNPEKKNNQDDMLDSFYYAFKDARPPSKTEAVENYEDFEKEKAKVRYFDWRKM